MAASSNPDEINLIDDDPDAYEVAVDPNMAATMGFTSFGSATPAAPAQHLEEDTPILDDLRPFKRRRFNQPINQPIAALRAQTRSRLKKAQAQGQDKGKDKGKQQQQQQGQQPQDGLNDDSDSDIDVDVDAEKDPDYEPDQDIDYDSSDPSAGGRTPISRPGRPTRKAPQDKDSGRDTPSQAASGQQQPEQQEQEQQQQQQPQPALKPHPNLPSRPPPARGGYRQGPGRGGYNPLWYVDYYDSSCNENPWEGMEKFKGLEPVGPFLPRYWDQQKATAAVAVADGSEGEEEWGEKEGEEDEENYY
ncbi:hypothetical protein VTJ04DRAFT_8606 [Mycothermus thermophilus]|uniref:uncharacterized protein n=1 Tax=Humicola insolens TaxID=85995 RepID=UPI003742EF47